MATPTATPHNTAPPDEYWVNKTNRTMLVRLRPAEQGGFTRPPIGEQAFRARIVNQHLQSPDAPRRQQTRRQQPRRNAAWQGLMSLAAWLTMVSIMALATAALVLIVTATLASVQRLSQGVAK